MIDYTNLKTYDYVLTEDLIAQTPLEKRDNSRLLVLNKETSEIAHKHFFDIYDYLKSGDVLVINNTRVIPARLYGYKETGAKLEVLLLKRHSLKVWECLMKPAKRLHIGEELVFSEELKCKLLEILPDGNRKIDIDEFVKGFRQLFPSLSEKTCKSLFKIIGKENAKKLKNRQNSYII